MTSKTVKQPNFTVAQEAAIKAAAPLDLAKATALGAEMGKGYRSIIAKAVRMGVAYNRKQPTTKTGEPVEKKEDIVADIAAIVEATLDGLEKAPKPALQAIRNYLNALDAGE